MVELPAVTKVERDELLTYLRARFESHGLDRFYATDYAVNIVAQFQVVP